MGDDQQQDAAVEAATLALRKIQEDTGHTCGAVIVMCIGHLVAQLHDAARNELPREDADRLLDLVMQESRRVADQIIEARA